jgi:hypothetical protein
MENPDVIHSTMLTAIHAKYVARMVSVIRCANLRDRHRCVTIAAISIRGAWPPASFSSQ